MLFVLILPLSSGSIVYPSSHAYAQESTNERPITVSGYLNGRELVYFDGSSSLEYLVITDDPAEAEATQVRYLLDFDGGEPHGSSFDLSDQAGSHVLVEGFLQQGDDEREAVVSVTSIEILNESEDYDTHMEGFLVGSQSLTSVRSWTQVVAPARYTDIEITPHSKEYYAGQFYEHGNYSLAAYWRDVSYGKFALKGSIGDWVNLPKTESYYLNFGGREEDLVASIDSQVDFDGPDNQIQNGSPEVLQDFRDRDDVDSLIGIYNGLIGDEIAGYSYLAPIRLATDEGNMFAYFIAISDKGLGSPGGVPSNYFVGLAAHEMGHNFGWHHTATQSCVYCDPWSLMSGGIYSDFGPSGPIASHRESEGWIEQDDIVQIKVNELQADQGEEFALDILGAPTGRNYLEAKVHFGSDGQYYTIEARKNVVNDHTPSEQTGLVVYNYSPMGHPSSLEPRSFETLVDTTGIGDLANADIDVGDSFVDLKNKITISNVAESDDGIFVRVALANIPDDEGDTCNGLIATIVGTSGDDILSGTAENDVIVGMGGNDHIYGIEGNDTICSGHGNDVIEGGDGEDILFGNFGNDSMSGGNGNDEIVGGRGNDRLDGGDGNDILSGWSGNDELMGGDGEDSLYGAEGDDYLLGGNGSDKLRGWLGMDTYADRNDHPN